MSFTQNKASMSNRETSLSEHGKKKIERGTDPGVHSKHVFEFIDFR